MNQRIDKDNYYLGIAKAVASRSTCLRRRYGAIIVKNDEIIATGYNGAPRGEQNCTDCGKCKREELAIPKGQRYELCVSVHAEANAIISAARRDMIGATIYIVGIEASDGSYANPNPCLMCRRLIKNAGIEQCIGLVNGVPEELSLDSPDIPDFGVEMSRESPESDDDTDDEDSTGDDQPAASERQIIDNFQGKYAFLSNFFGCEVPTRDGCFPSAEAAFQAMKVVDPATRAKFLRLSPSGAKHLGRTVALRPDWETVKDDIMRSVVASKFAENPYLRASLLETGDAILVEGNTWHDNYWGACRCDRCKAKEITGKNRLGEILMEVRKTLQDQAVPTTEQ